MKSCEVALRRFSEQYKNTPGVLGVEKDGFFSDSILVFIDKNKYDHQIPSEFGGFEISLYDVRYMMNASIRFLRYIHEEGVDLSNPETITTCEHFVQTVELCERLLCLQDSKEK